jgi:hypothetical protein
LAIEMNIRKLLCRVTAFFLISPVEHGAAPVAHNFAEGRRSMEYEHIKSKQVVMSFLDLQAYPEDN